MVPSSEGFLLPHPALSYQSSTNFGLKIILWGELQGGEETER